MHEVMQRLTGGVVRVGALQEAAVMAHHLVLGIAGHVAERLVHHQKRRVVLNGRQGKRDARLLDVVVQRRGKVELIDHGRMMVPTERVFKKMTRRSLEARGIIA